MNEAGGDFGWAGPHLPDSEVLSRMGTTREIYDPFPRPRSPYLRRRAAAPGTLGSDAGQRQRTNPVDAQYPTEYPADDGGDGHGHRIAHGDRHGAAGRTGDRAPQSLDRAAGR